MVNLEGARSGSFRIILENHLVTAEAAEADIGDSIKRKHYRVSLNNIHEPLQLAHSYSLPCDKRCSWI